MKAYNSFLNLLQTLPSPKYFTESPKGADMVAKTPFVVIKGSPKCLTRGFDSLRGKKGTEVRKIQTRANEIMEKNFKMVFVQEYDPVTRDYEDLGDFWVDITTGTLYDPCNGVCQSSTMIWMVLE